MTLLDKTTLRQQIQAKRRHMPAEARLQAAEQLSHHISQSAIFAESHNIACYFSCRDEINTDIIIKTIWQSGKNCFLPVIDPRRQHTLVFIPYHPNDTLIKNKYSIHEPVFSEHKIYSITQLDLIFMPLVAFDGKGHRLGSGGGYYDRTLTAFNERDESQGAKPLLIGLAYELQRLDFLPSDPWDIHLNGVVTEKGIEFF